MGIRANHTINFIRNITFEYICLTYKSTRFTTSRTTFINSTTIHRVGCEQSSTTLLPTEVGFESAVSLSQTGTNRDIHVHVGNSVHLLAILISAEISKCFLEFGGYSFQDELKSDFYVSFWLSQI